jgi:Zn-finger nucleic acid-binding protein
MDCPECERLWLDLGEAVRAHVKIAGQLQVARIAQDSGLIDSLEPLFCQTLERHTVARKAFRAHAATHTEQE